MELNFHETFLIEVLRKFDFLRTLGYEVTGAALYRDPRIVFQNKSADRIIAVSWEGDLLLTIERKQRLFSRSEKSVLLLQDYYADFNISLTHTGGVVEKLLIISELLRNNFLPLLKGDAWIEDILQ